MIISLKTRLHEWLADRVDWVQYPNVRAVSASARLKRPGIKWASAMPIGKRIEIVLMSLGLLVVAVPLLVVTLIVAYIFLSVIAGF